MLQHEEYTIQQDDLAIDDPFIQATNRKKEKVCAPLQLLRMGAIIFIVSAILLGIFAVVIILEIRNQSTQTQEPQNMVFVKFPHFTIKFDVDKQRPIASTQFGWNTNHSSSRGHWKSNPVSVITTEDFKYLKHKGSPMDRGHLSPFATLGKESMTIINVVPQYSCHNQIIWRLFEEFVTKHYKDEVIVTYPKYNEEEYLDRVNGRLYVPSHICKTIRGIDYCMPHNLEICRKKWCEHLTPKLVGSC
eukprot:gene12544-6365_t